MAGKKEVETKDAKKAQALNDAIKQIEKQFGKGSVMKLGDRAAVDVAVNPTGSLTLDMALGIGGYPKGRIIEIYGPESSGKTTLTLHAIAEVQKQGGTAAFIDAEHAIDPVYAKNQFININTEIFRIVRVNRIFRIDEGSTSSLLLYLRNRMQSKCCFTARFRTVNFNNPSFRISTDPQCFINFNRSR